MVKFSKKAISLVLTLLMVISMVSFSGLTASAAVTQKTVETEAGKATYIVRMNGISESYVDGVLGTLTYPASKLTLVDATVSAEFASSKINTDTAGKIIWSCIGDVSYAADKAVLTVNFNVVSGATVTAADFVGSDWQLVTNSEVDNQATAKLTLGNDVVGLVEEIGLPKADDPTPPVPDAKLELNADVASSYILQNATITKTVEGEAVQETFTVLMGVMPRTTLVNFMKIFKPVAGHTVKVMQNAADVEYTSGNTRTGARAVLVRDSDNAIVDTLYVAVRGDLMCNGLCNGPGKLQLTRALGAGAATYFESSISTVGTCKLYAAGSINAFNNISVNAIDKLFMTGYIARGIFAR